MKSSIEGGFEDTASAPAERAGGAFSTAPEVGAKGAVTEMRSGRAIAAGPDAGSSSDEDRTAGRADCSAAARAGGGNTALCSATGSDDISAGFSGAFSTGLSTGFAVDAGVGVAGVAPRVGVRMKGERGVCCFGRSATDFSVVAGFEASTAGRSERAMIPASDGVEARDARGLVVVVRRRSRRRASTRRCLRRVSGRASRTRPRSTRRA